MNQTQEILQTCISFVEYNKYQITLNRPPTFM